MYRVKLEGVDGYFYVDDQEGIDTLELISNREVEEIEVI